MHRLVYQACRGFDDFGRQGQACGLLNNDGVRRLDPDGLSQYDASGIHSADTGFQIVTGLRGRGSGIQDVRKSGSAVGELRLGGILSRLRGFHDLARRLQPFLSRNEVEVGGHDAKRDILIGPLEGSRGSQTSGFTGLHSPGTPSEIVDVVLQLHARLQGGGVEQKVSVRRSERLGPRFDCALVSGQRQGS